MNKYILVTGGAGYIGSHTCKLLAKHGYTSIVYDNLSRGNKWSVKWGIFIQGNISDQNKLRKIFQKYNPIAVIHFAGYAYVGESVEFPNLYYSNNVVGTSNLLEAMRLECIQNIVFSSTCATYGIPNSIPIIEDHQQNPVNPYGRTKLIIEKMLKDYNKAYNLNYVALRYFNAAGADPEGDIGEVHNPESHLIPILLDVALGKRDVVEIYGTDYETEDGTCIRDYIHVNDLGMAHISALDYLLKGEKSICLNLGTGKGYSVNQVIKATESITGKKISVRTVNRREGDPPVLVSASKLIKNKLRLSNNYLSLDEQIEDAWKWHLKFFK
ncbi:MAG: UDP-glucose 4-epimerase GalE [Candidatus Marinimicrobia bacterium]|nr:UDP-glucose 4-epimerase GalE [Candidatus Neomarinimicrobiota bacterium]MBL7109682.1 UDP-glucose 4-epimerase GalE [Candidatus Neomarinimicrobiota bacterium]